MHKPTEDGIVTLIDGSAHIIPAVVVSGGDHTCILDFLYLRAISTFFLPFFYSFKVGTLKYVEWYRDLNNERGLHSHG